jgi:hypothetical protein
MPVSGNAVYISLVDGPFLIDIDIDIDWTLHCMHVLSRLVSLSVPQMQMEKDLQGADLGPRKWF